MVKQKLAAAVRRLVRRGWARPREVERLVGRFTHAFLLERSALNQERELEMTLGTIMGLFEPAMVVFMGGLVLTIVLAILLPIFDLNTMVR